jgi:cysteinyl-tRNA synthetase
VKGNYAYVTEPGNVYFSVAKKADYGKLSHRGLTEIITGTRVEAAADKRSSADFALWKAAPVGNDEMTWASPWGRGYPGWHIECSAMSRKYLGDTFDIHGSGLEHIFPHHENEIAQSEALTGEPMANYWVHTGMLLVNGQKMSKSLKNTILIQDALKHYSANEIRLAFMLSHYRKPFDYTKSSMEQGKALRAKLFKAYATTQESNDSTKLEPVIEALYDDIDTPRALQLLSETAETLSKKELDTIFKVLGLRYMSYTENPEVVKLVGERETARANRDYLTSDNRKAEIEQHGFDVLDMQDTSLYIPR